MKTKKFGSQESSRDGTHFTDHEVFAMRIVAQLESLRRDPDEWASYVEECEMFGGYGPVATSRSDGQG